MSVYTHFGAKCAPNFTPQFLGGNASDKAQIDALFERAEIFNHELRAFVLGAREFIGDRPDTDMPCAVFGRHFFPDSAGMSDRALMKRVGRLYRRLEKSQRRASFWLLRMQTGGKDAKTKQNLAARWTVHWGPYLQQVQDAVLAMPDGEESPLQCARLAISELFGNVSGLPRQGQRNDVKRPLEHTHPDDQRSSNLKGGITRIVRAALYDARKGFDGLRTIEQAFQTVRSRFENKLAGTSCDIITATKPVPIHGHLLDTTILSGLSDADDPEWLFEESPGLPAEVTPYADSEADEVAKSEHQEVRELSADEVKEREKILAAALKLVSYGLKVGPGHRPQPKGGCTCRKRRKCTSIGKHYRVPRSRSTFSKIASNNPDRVRELFAECKLSNVGISTDGLVVLDIDSRSGGELSLAYLREAGVELTRTLTALSGNADRKSVHYFYRRPKGLKACVGTLGPGIDIKSDGGYLVGAGSLHESGHRYEILVDAPIADLPPSLASLLAANQPLRIENRKKARSSVGKGSPQRETSAQFNAWYENWPTDKLIPHGRRNSFLFFAIACPLRGRGADCDEILSGLKQARDTQCEANPPFCDDELLKIASSAMRYTPNAAKKKADRAIFVDSRRAA
jgi:hypothetical protein